MQRYIFLGVVVPFMMACQFPLTAGNVLSCAQDDRVVDACYSVHGSLMFHANMRAYISLDGAEGLLGLVGKTEAEDTDYYWPDGIGEVLSSAPETVVTGNFLVCPFTKKKRGEMQKVCIESVGESYSRKLQD